MAQKRSEGVVKQVIGKVKETAGKVLGNSKAKPAGKREPVAATAAPQPPSGAGKASAQKARPGGAAEPGPASAPPKRAQKKAPARKKG